MATFQISQIVITVDISLENSHFFYSLVDNVLRGFYCFMVFFDGSAGTVLAQCWYKNH